MLEMKCVLCLSFGLFQDFVSDIFACSVEGVLVGRHLVKHVPTTPLSFGL